MEGDGGGGVRPPSVALEMRDCVEQGSTWECPHVKSSFKNIYDFLSNLCKTQQWNKNCNFDFDEKRSQY